MQSSELLHDDLGLSPFVHLSDDQLQDELDLDFCEDLNGDISNQEAPIPKIRVVGHVGSGSLDSSGVLVMVISLSIVFAFQKLVNPSGGKDRALFLASRGSAQLLNLSSDSSSDDEDDGDDCALDAAGEEVRFTFVGIFVRFTVTRASLCLRLCSCLGRQVGKIKSRVTRMFVCVRRAANARIFVSDSWPADLPSTRPSVPPEMPTRR